MAQDSDVSRAPERAHWATRGVAEIGMGTLFGAAIGGGAFLTGILIDPTNLRSIKATIAVSGIVYPAAVASGAILGGYLTDSRSTYWEPFVGAYAGALIADLTAYFLSDDYPVFTALLVLILPVITTTIAMEGSHSRRSHGGKRITSMAYMPLTYGFSF